MTSHYHQHFSRRRFLSGNATAVVAAVAASMRRLPAEAQRAYIFAYAPETVKRIYIVPDDHADYLQKHGTLITTVGDGLWRYDVYKLTSQ
jgi:hypothetical protein